MKSKIQKISERINEIDQEIEKFSVNLRHEKFNLILERIAEIKKSSFLWKDKEYLVSDIKWSQEYYYDNCPYTPGWVQAGYKIEFKQSDEPDSKRIILNDYNHVEENKRRSWYKDTVEEYENFLKMFKETFGVEMSHILQLQEGEKR